MKNNKTVHDLANSIERLRIMLDIVKNKKFEQVSKEELIEDLESTLVEIKDRFDKLLQ